MAGILGRRAQPQRPRATGIIGIRSSRGPLVVKIGPFELTAPLALAPMAGVTDRPFRSLCRGFGAGLAATEMVSADTQLWHTGKSRHRLDHAGEQEPRVVQIAGSDPAMMARAAGLNVSMGAQIIDINMGCPAKKVCKHAAGSALMRDERLVRAILEAVVRSAGVPVTLKMRTGWDRDNRNAVSIARMAEDIGVAALAVHGRTRADRFAGVAEFATIADVVRSVAIPVLANGDIDSPEKAREVLRETGAAGVMIGRAAQGRPWIFRQVKTYLSSGVAAGPPCLGEARDIIIAHLESLHAFYGEDVGVRMARKHLGWYSHQLSLAPRLPVELLTAVRSADQLRLADEFLGTTGCTTSRAA
jgi:tRNA-dihydrouridine synthase B